MPHPLDSQAQTALTNQIPKDWQQIGQDYGFASTLYRIPLPDHQTAILKLWEAPEESQRTELHFYQSLSKEIGIPTPTYLHDTHNETHAALILEDVQNTTQGDCLTTPTPEQAENLITALAQFHKSWWNTNPQLDHPFFTNIPKADPTKLQENATHYLNRFQDQLTPRDKEILQNPVPLYQQVFDQIQTHPQVIIHADFHLDNILFKTTDQTPVVLDWARVRQGSYAINLAHVLFDMADPNQIQNLILTYTTTLNKLTEQEVKTHLRQAVLYNFIVASTGTANWIPKTPRQERLIQDAIQRRTRSLNFLETESQI